MNEFEDRLRAHLADQARHAPDGDALAEQIIAASSARHQVNVVPLHRHPRTWMYPLIAAAAVAVVALSLVGLSHLGNSNGHPVAQQTSTRPPPSTVVTTPSPTPSTTGPTRVTPSPTTTVLVQNSTQLLTHVRVLDLTFVSNTEGWALATADCLDPTATAPACPAMLHTTNAGTSWTTVPNPPANVPIDSSCAEPCIQHIRFATDRIGYAFGPSTLLMTTDGGASWKAQTGGADALETLDGNVIRVVHQGQGCPPGCVYGVQTAPIGSTAWKPVRLPAATSSGMSVGVSLTRTGSSAYLAVFGHTSGGGSNARTNLYRSTDDGASWTNGGEPCSSVGGAEVDSTQLTSGADGSVTVLCSRRGSTPGEFTSTAYASQPTFRAGAATALNR
ncbi:MAG: hypothetical protein ABI301_06295, partial [Jatrophihabitantaceae bacterium]